MGTEKRGLVNSSSTTTSTHGRSRIVSRGRRVERPVRLCGAFLIVITILGTAIIQFPPKSYAASSTPGTITKFPGIADPNAITTGSDGNLWFTNGRNNSIGRIRPSGVVTTFTDPRIDRPIDITAGPDGALWFTNEGEGGLFEPYQGASIGRITTSGTFSFYTDPSMSGPYDITAGPDGALWFTNFGVQGAAASSIGRITTAGVVTDYTDPTISSPYGITAGPDGALWFTQSSSTAGVGDIGRITTTGIVTNFSSVHGNLGSITAGPDGAVWFSAGVGVGRITTSGVVSYFTSSKIFEGAASLTPGPNGNLWFTDYYQIGEISTGGTVTMFPDYPINSPAVLGGITAGPDGALWFTDGGDSEIGRITTTGTVNNYSGSGIIDPMGIAAGSDGAMWFTNTPVYTFVQSGFTFTPVYNVPASIGRISTSGAISTYTDSSITDPQDITAGPDGALWFTDDALGSGQQDSIGRISTTGAVTSYPNGSMAAPQDITTGPDGALWFTTSNSIGRLTTTGTMSIYSDSRINGARGITTGPDGALWFANTGGNSIGRITTSGTLTFYTDPSIVNPYDIATGPDGALWFTNYGTSAANYTNSSIDRLTTTGSITTYSQPTQFYEPQGIAAGPDGNMWFTAIYNGNNVIGEAFASGGTSGIAVYHDNGILPQGIAAGPDGNMWFTNSNNMIAQISAGATTLKQQISSQATPNTTIGSPISDSATLTGLTSTAGGTVTFTAYSDAQCQSAVFTSRAIRVRGDGTYPATGSKAASYSPTQPGNYYWIARYSGDKSNPPLVGTCGAPGEESVVTLVPNPWGGYVLLHPPSGVGAHADIQVSSVDCSSIGRSASWVGFDGYNSKSISSSTVEQIGVDENCFTAGGAPTYDLWYELYSTSQGTPEVPITLKPLPNTKSVPPLGPGDVMNVEVDHLGSTDYFSVSVSNSRGNLIALPWDKNVSTKTLKPAPKYVSMECVAEDPLLQGGTRSPLANFGTVIFKSCSAVDNPGNGKNLVKLNMADPSGQLQAVTSPVTRSNAGSQFTVSVVSSG